MTNSRSARQLAKGVGFYALLIGVLVVTLFPFYWMIITSLKNSNEIFNLTGIVLWVDQPTLENYASLLRTPYFGQWAWNSIVVATVTTVVSLLIAIPAGYAIARLKFRGATLFGILIFITYLVPKTLLFIPLAQLLAQWGILGETFTLLLTYPTFVIPFCAWLLTGYFRTIPVDLEECARIDGCTRIGALIRITLPLAIPAILTAGIFAFTLAWNDLLYALVFLSGDANKTLTLGATSSLMVSDYFFWGPLMAASVLASLPVALLYFFFVDLYVSGLTAGAVKG